MDAINREKLRANLDAADTGEKKPDGIEAPDELSETEVFNAREAYAQRAQGAKNELHKGSVDARAVAAKEQVALSPEDDRKLNTVDQRAAEAEFALLQKLDAAKRKLDEAKAAFQKTNGAFSGLTKERREKRSSAQTAMLEAEDQYQAQLGKMQGSEKGIKALNMHLGREQMAAAETSLKKTEGLRGKLMGSERKAATKEYAAHMKEQYEKSRAEVVGDHVGAVLQEQIALADTRALEMQKQDLEIYQLHKALSGTNIAALIGWQPTTRLGKMVGNGLNARTAVNLALVGAGVGIAASGGGFVVGASLGGLYLTRRLMGGAAAAAGAYDLLRMRKSAKVEKAIASQDVKALSDSELLEASAQLESQSILNGVRVSENGTYKKIATEREARASKTVEGGTEGKKRDVQATLRTLMAETDSAFAKMYAQEQQADAKLRKISLGIAVFVGSGAMAETLKGVWHAAEYVSDATGLSDLAGAVARKTLDAVVAAAHAETPPPAIPAVSLEDMTPIEPLGAHQFALQFDSVATHIHETPGGEWVQDGMRFHMLPNGHIDADFQGQHFDLGTRNEPNEANWGFVMGVAQATEGAAKKVAEHVDAPHVDAPVPEPVAAVSPTEPDDEVVRIRPTADPLPEAAMSHGSAGGLSEILKSEAPVAERTAALRALLQEQGADAPGGKVLISPDNKQIFVMAMNGDITYHTFAPDGMVDAQEHSLVSADDWSGIGASESPEIELRGVEHHNPGDPGSPERILPTEVHAAAVEAAPVKISDATYLTHFFDSSASVASRSEGIQKLIEHLGSPDGSERTLGLKGWNVQFYASSDGHLSYAMKDPDGGIISLRIPLNSETDWKTMSEHMQTDVAPIEGHRATGLFVEEAEKALRKEVLPHFPSPGEMAEGAAKGIRTADDGLDRGLDTGANWLDKITGGDDIDPEKQAEMMRKLGVSEENIAKVQSRVEVQHRDTLPDPGKAAEFKAARAAEDAAADRAALDAATAQHLALKGPSDINPAAVEAARAQLATGKLQLPNGETVEFDSHGKGFRISTEGGPSKVETTRDLFSGREYKSIIGQNQETVNYSATEQIAYVEEHAQALDAYLKARDFMIANGLTDTKEYTAVQDAISGELKHVNRFGHVLADDPNYGNPSTGQVVKKFISAHKGPYNEHGPHNEFEGTRIGREIDARGDVPEPLRKSGPVPPTVEAPKPDPVTTTQTRVPVEVARPVQVAPEPTRVPEVPRASGPMRPVDAAPIIPMDATFERHAQELSALVRAAGVTPEGKSFKVLAIEGGELHATADNGLRFFSTGSKSMYGEPVTPDTAAKYPALKRLLESQP